MELWVSKRKWQSLWYFCRCGWTWSGDNRLKQQRGKEQWDAMNTEIGYKAMIWEIRSQQEDRKKRNLKRGRPEREIFYISGFRQCRHLRVRRSSCFCSNLFLWFRYKICKLCMCCDLTAQVRWIYLWSTFENLPLDSVLWFCPKNTQFGIIHVCKTLALYFWSWCHSRVFNF